MLLAAAEAAVAARQRRLHLLILYLKAAVNSLHSSRRWNNTPLLCCTHSGQQKLKSNPGTGGERKMLSGTESYTLEPDGKWK